MSKKVTLPSGATVTVKDPSKIRVKDRKRVMKSTDVEGGELTRAMALSDSLIAMLVEEWSFDLVLPSVKLDVLDELEIPDYDALVELSKELQSALFPNLNDTPENEADPKAPSENSNA